MPKSKPGARCRYAGEEPFGTLPDGIRPGTEVTVRELVPAGEAGAHTDTEDSVVVEWEQADVAYDDQGAASLIHRSRATSIAADVFGDLFEAVA